MKRAETGSENFLTIAGKRLFFRESGPQTSGNTLVLLHGFPDHSTNLERLFEALAEKHHVITYDQSGQGLSDKPLEPPYTLEYYADELEVLRQSRGLRSLVLIGHSIGGAIASIYAAKYPEHVKALIHINPAMKDFTIQTGMNRFGAWFLQWSLLGELMLKIHPRWITYLALRLAFYDHSRITPEIVDSFHRPFKIAGARKSYLKTMRHLYFMTDEEMLRTLHKLKEHNLPIKIIWSANDRNMPISDGEYLKEQMSASLYILKDCGHCPHLELDDERLKKDLVAPIEAFLKDLD